jgi:hypothetical protein
MLASTILYDTSFRAAAEHYASSQSQQHSIIDVNTMEKQFSDGSLDSAVYFGHLQLAAVYRVLKAGGTLTAIVALSGADAQSQQNEMLMKLLMQGFVNSTVEVAEDALHISADKPGFEGASASISYKPVHTPK